MKLSDCINRIDKYMHSHDCHPRLVNVQNSADMNAIISHFNVGTTTFKGVENYAKKDENPSEPALFNDLRTQSGCVFLTGFTSHYKLLGEKRLRELLKNLVSFTGSNLHLIVLCYQCDKYLKFSDSRFNLWVYNVDGASDPVTQVIFTAPGMPILQDTKIVNGIENLSAVIEKQSPKSVSVQTKKSKKTYLHSLYEIDEQSNAYSLLCSIDQILSQIDESYGTEAQWKYALDKVTQKGSWSALITEQFGSIHSLELSISNWKLFDDTTRWMYYIALKLFGTPNSWCLNKAAELASSDKEVVRGIYRGILEKNTSDEDYWACYNERKHLIQTIGYSEVEAADYCSWLGAKGKEAIYYLSDMSPMEINMIFKELDTYGLEYSENQMLNILSHVYPNLYQYLSPYDYKSDLLNTYFKEYKYQKVVNKLLPDFLAVVNEQAIQRDYLRLLPARSEKTESINMDRTLVYFVDAMGVEYLAYIMAKCQEKQLMAYTTLCHCELPSITSHNKEFIDVFEKHGAAFAPDKNGIKALDEIKHHGEEDIEDGKSALPTHLATELEIISGIIDKSFKYLYQQKYDRIVLISDHGASRLCVIGDQENQHCMATKGMHSGRCCPKDESDTQPDCAIDADDYWVLANYDRFKGSRKANVEVHGGATLEEVVIPIIEITRPIEKYEFSMITPKIKYSKRKKNAIVSIFSKEKIDNITVRISGIEKMLPTDTSDGQNFSIAIPDLKTSGDFELDVYYRDNPIFEGLKFHADNSDFKEKKLL